MSQLSLLTANPKYSEASQIIPTINYLIGLMNTAFGSGGSGNISSAIYIPTVANAINKLSITPGATGGSVVVTAGGDGSDTNIGLILTSKGSDPTSLGGTGASAGAVLQLVTVANSANFLQVTSATSGAPFVAVNVGGATASTTLSVAAGSTGLLCLQGTTSATAAIQVPTVANSANFLQVTSSTSAAPLVVVNVAGATAAAGLNLAAGSTGILSLQGITSASATVQVIQTASSVDFLKITSSATSATAAVELAANGTDTDVYLRLVAQGSGTLQFGATIFQANGAVATAITSLGPTNSRSNIQKWLRIIDNAGASFFIPMW